MYQCQQLQKYLFQIYAMPWLRPTPIPLGMWRRFTETVFKEKHGEWDPLYHISRYLNVNSVVRYPPPLQREKGGMGKISPIWLSTFALPL